MNVKPLLSIAIPTYNRAEYLKISLAQICKQSKEYDNLIEIIVSDNCSTDDTYAVVNNKKENGYIISYIRNTNNIGLDANIEQCFSIAKGKYVWIFGDDDFLLEGALKNIIKILQNGEYGNIYLNNFWYAGDLEKEDNLEINEFIHTIYDNKEYYLKKINYWVTFCSGNITNKDILPKSFNSKKYLGTELTLVHWILTASILSKNNVYVETKVLACKAGNSSGNYKLFKVFGEYLRKICSEVFIEFDVSPKVLRIIDNSILLHFFPHFIIDYKRKKLNDFVSENPESVFYNEYKDNIIFWLLDYPLFFLPKKINNIYLISMQRIIIFFHKLTL